jgi:hypothetical protein
LIIYMSYDLREEKILNLHKTLALLVKR